MILGLRKPLKFENIENIEMAVSGFASYLRRMG